ncbi:hypothetical protein ACFSC6_07815 [Rufibacter sediminis]|uniref:Lipoprotein n=1 Tax=Rufibacter sediminis TaxID=2762756 RepID=A0ABR6VPY6_9BACT|nr:hypothetical protein [Rufibacter sediminis]MBC3539248.1 hypothetical protein [Rufibacter sediminis]
MIKTFLQILLVFALTSCGKERFDEETISKLEQYQSARKILIDNLEQIKIPYGYEELVGKSPWIPSIIFRTDEDFFKNKVAPISPELNSLLKLWQNKSLAKGYSMQINEDSTIIFTIKKYEGIFTGVHHYIVYDPKGKSEGVETQNSSIIKKKQLDSQWFYIIASQLYID